MSDGLPDSRPSRRWFARLSGLAERLRIGRILETALPVLSIVAGITTYVVLTSTQSPAGNPTYVLRLLQIDGILLLALAVVVARRFVGLWIERRRGSAGSRLHVRFSVMFGLVAVAPTIIVLLFSILFFDLGMQSWFSERVGNTLEGARAAAQGYLSEHKENIRADVLRIARDLNRDAAILETNPRLMNQALNLQTQLRGLTEAIVFDGTGKVLARSGLVYALEFEPIDSSYMESARAGEVPIFVNDSDDRVRALIRLDSFLDAYLFVGRFVDASVLAHMERTREAVDEFYNLKAKSADIQISLTLVFLVVALLLVMAAVWLGLNVATGLSQSISELIAAVDKIRGGDLSVRVRELPPDDEIGSLSHAFNLMTDQLDAQRRDLVEANGQLDERRRFTETVLSGVSAGVIGLDRSGKVNLSNRSAARLLGIEAEAMLGKPLDELVPEMVGLLMEARRLGPAPIEAQIKIVRHGDIRTLMVAIAIEVLNGRTTGFVVTFDDVSELLAAQWKGAWADVARRIAHEIRNPLTPIQLSAERLKRKYLKEITSDRETFEVCTDTIIRQVDDIGRMIEEFSNFARMPAPVLRLENLNEVCRQAIFLQRNAHSEIGFVTELPEQPVYAICDGHQIGQVVTNLLQNAVDAMDRRKEPLGDPPRIALRLKRREDETTVVEVEDNGPGLPAEGRERLTEPYVTTHSKGTGLGLAIARKIMEDHGGVLLLGDAPGGGALVSLEFRNGGASRTKTKVDPQQIREATSHGS